MRDVFLALSLKAKPGERKKKHILSQESMHVGTISVVLKIFLGWLINSPSSTRRKAEGASPDRMCLHTPQLPPPTTDQTKNKKKTSKQPNLTPTFITFSTKCLKMFKKICFKWSNTLKEQSKHIHQQIITAVYVETQGAPDTFRRLIPVADTQVMIQEKQGS